MSLHMTITARQSNNLGAARELVNTLVDKDAEEQRRALDYKFQPQTTGPNRSACNIGMQITRHPAAHVAGWRAFLLPFAGVLVAKSLLLKNWATKTQSLSA